MTVKEDVRASQTEQFDRFGEEGKPVLTEVLNLYDKIDALTPDQRSLLAITALGGVSAQLRKMLAHVNDPGSVHGFGTIAVGLCALAGYATEVSREESGATSTGDSRVEDVLEAYADILKAQSRLLLPPHLAKIGDEVVAQAHARESRGEDFEEALLDELSKVKLPDAPAAADESTPDGYGLYL